MIVMTREVVEPRTESIFFHLLLQVGLYFCAVWGLFISPFARLLQDTVAGRKATIVQHL